MTPHNLYGIVSSLFCSVFLAICLGYALGLSSTPPPLEAPCPSPSLPTPKP